MAKWIQTATRRMKAKGTLGKFGKATPKKIAAAKKKGGKAEKRAVFAENMKKIAAREETSMKCYVTGPASKVSLTRKNPKSNTKNTKSESRKKSPRKRG